MAVYLESLGIAPKHGLFVFIDFIVPVLMVLGLFLLVWEHARYRKRIRYLEITLGSLSKLAGVSLTDPTFVPLQVRNALDKGHRLKAIRLYRNITGATLSAATEVVDVLLKKP